MTGRVIHQAAPRHDCTGLPDIPQTWTAWQCDECGDIWTFSPSAPLTNGTSPTWLRGLPDPSHDWKPRRPRWWNR